jgi:hypothetical protein
MVKIFGIGLNKTGTKTLGECLRQFGCRHTTFDLMDLRNFKRGNLALLLEKMNHFDSGEDWPWPLMVETLDEAFPEAKFILTIRKTPEIWFTSLCKHAEKTGPTEGRVLVYGYAMPHLYRQQHLDFYNRHNQTVMKYFQERPDKLLVVCWEKGDGWAELCGFLGRPQPAMPFPHVNKSKAAG